MTFTPEMREMVQSHVQQNLEIYHRVRNKRRHIDDITLEAFTAELRDKLQASRDKGREGWETPECTAESLSQMLREHVEKGDPRDVAIFAMFLWARKESITKG